MFCSKCGAQIEEDGANFCSSCGQSTQRAPASQPASQPVRNEPKPAVQPRPASAPIPSLKPKRKFGKARLAVYAVLGVAVIGFIYYMVGPISVFGRSTDFRCDMRGGVMIEAGCGYAGCRYECAKEYSDGGKGCSSSKDCQGKCIVYGDFQNGAPQGGPGKCASTSLLKNCSWAYELLNGGQVKVASDCSM